MFDFNLLLYWPYVWLPVDLVLRIRKLEARLTHISLSSSNHKINHWKACFSNDSSINFNKIVDNFREHNSDGTGQKNFSIFFSILLCTLVYSKCFVLVGNSNSSISLKTRTNIHLFDLESKMIRAFIKLNAFLACMMIVYSFIIFVSDPPKWPTFLVTMTTR